MKFNALQKYLLKVYAITILVLTVIVPFGTSSYNFIFVENYNNVNISLLLVEYLALTLALVASLLGTAEKKK